MRDSSNFSMLDFWTLLGAVVMLGAFVVAPWFNVETRGGPEGVAAVCYVLPRLETAGREIAFPVTQSFLLLIPVAGISAVLFALWGFFVPKYSRVASIFVAFAGLTGLMHYGVFFAFNRRSELDAVSSMGAGFWLTLVIAVLLTLQVFIRRPVVDSGESAAMEAPHGKASLGLKIGTLGAILFLHFPLVVIILYAFTTEGASFTFPPPALTLGWLGETCNRADFWRALNLSLAVAAITTVIALILGTLTAAAIHRSRFFGRETISLLLVLPIALPGIVTGIALRSSMGLVDQIDWTLEIGTLKIAVDPVVNFGLWTIIIGHATFCIVTVYNNAIARFRRISQTLIEASMDLGANSFQTFRYVILPNIATALLAGGMLSFALSFDEVIVTTFTAGQQQTLPIWIYSQLFRPRDRPVTNVAAIFVIATTFIPILLAYHFTRNTQE